MRQVTVIPGDGIGPDIIDSAKKVIESTGVEIEWVHALAGECALSELGNPFLMKLSRLSPGQASLSRGLAVLPLARGFAASNVYHASGI